MIYFLQASHNRELPPIIFGLISLLSGVLALHLPETRGAPLQQTPMQGETFVRENACFGRFV